MEEDKIFTLARHIIKTDYEMLPTDVAEGSKKLITDTLAVSLCGSVESGVNELVEIFGDWGGREDSTVWVYGDKMPCINAAQINATMVHASDYDDTHDPSPTHVGTVAVPTALAIAEMLGGIDGKKIITVVTLAADFMVRLCMACKIPMVEGGWHYTALHGNFTAAAVAGKLLGLNEEELVNAFGLAYHQASGNVLCVQDGSLAKRVGPGFAARNGIISALMAQKGITGAKRSLEAPYGLYNFYHRGEYKPERLTLNLGEKYEVVDLSFKPYPCCRNTHPAIDATLEIIREHKIKAEDVDAINITVSSWALRELCEPADIKINPRTIVDGQFSIPWTVAVAIARGKVGVDGFTEDAIKDRAVLSLSNKVTAKAEASHEGRGVTPATVEIKTSGGGFYSKRVDVPYGSPENPMSMDAIFEKFRDCALHAAKPMNNDTVEELLQIISRFESVDNMALITDLLC
jgi:2-methylcitrate dehydratase PrpD